MTVYLQGLYTDILDEYNLGAGNDRTSRLFVRAVNRSLSELRKQIDDRRTFNAVTAVDSFVSTLGDAQEYILYHGARAYMVRGGAAPGDPKIAKIVYDDSRQSWEQAKNDYWTMNLNDCQATDSNSVIGLGYQADS